MSDTPKPLKTNKFSLGLTLLLVVAILGGAGYGAKWYSNRQQERAKAARGERVRAVFFVADAAMFPARPLLDAMRRDPRFDARIAIIPDLRGIAGGDPLPAMERCRAALAEAYPPEALLPVARGADGQWPDVLSDFGADLVCHPSPYELSDFRYNPRWCVGRPFLPVHVNYGYYRSVYDRHVMASRNYALFWKAFFECDATLAEYRERSILRGANAEVVGYVKMDPLASFPPNPGHVYILYSKLQIEQLSLRHL